MLHRLECSIELQINFFCGIATTTRAKIQAQRCAAYTSNCPGRELKHPSKRKSIMLLYVLLGLGKRSFKKREKKEKKVLFAAFQ